MSYETEKLKWELKQIEDALIEMKREIKRNNNIINKIENEMKKIYIICSCFGFCCGVLIGVMINVLK